MKRVHVTHKIFRRGKGVMLLKAMYFLAGFSVATGLIVFCNHYRLFPQSKGAYRELKEIHIEHNNKPNQSGHRILRSALV